MSIKSRFANRHKRKDWNHVRNLIHTGDPMHDTDKPPVEAAPPQLVVTPINFAHPPGFEGGAFLIVAVDKNGNPFTNAPPDPAMGLHLAQVAQVYCSRQAIRALQPKEERPSIVAPPPGLTIPPWAGPAGRR